MEGGRFICSALTYGAVLWKCNTDLDADVYALIAFRSLAVSGRDEHQGTKVRGLFAIKHYGPKSMTDFNAEEVYEYWLTLVV
jgi:hypothetical protein